MAGRGVIARAALVAAPEPWLAAGPACNVGKPGPIAGSERCCSCCCYPQLGVAKQHCGSLAWAAELPEGWNLAAPAKPSPFRLHLAEPSCKDSSSRSATATGTVGRS